MSARKTKRQPLVEGEDGWLVWRDAKKCPPPAKTRLRNLHLAFQGHADHFEYVKSLLKQMGPTP